MRGRLISFEGGEGAGKSTVIGAVDDWLREHAITPLRVREPGGTAVGEAIRDVLLGRDRGEVCAETELLLMFASRAQLIRERVQPALARGEWVIADRFTDASFAYQGGGRGIDPARIAELERWTVGFRPDLTLLLDVDVQVGLQRALGRSGEADRIESEPAAFFERVRDRYRALAAAEPARWQIIDAGQPVEQVVAAARAAMAQAWQQWQ